MVCPWVIVTELENVTLCKMIDNRLVKFYGQYVDETLVLAKPEHFRRYFVST